MGRKIVELSESYAETAIVPAFRLRAASNQNLGPG
jgi:hypothetical protein